MTHDELTNLRIQCEAIVHWGGVTPRVTLELIAELARVTDLNRALFEKIAICSELNLGLAERCAFQSELLAKRSERADPTIVTADWLRSIGFVDYCEVKDELLLSPASQSTVGPPYLLYGRAAGGGWEIRDRDGESVECGPFETRGEVRAVCSALFITLVETPADKFWDDAVGKIRKAKGLSPLTPEEADAAFDAAPEVPMSADEIASIADAVTSAQTIEDLR